MALAQDAARGLADGGEGLRQQRVEGLAVAGALAQGVGLAAQLDGQQVDDGVQPDDELRSLALDRVGEAVRERRRSACGVARHAAKGSP